MTQLGKSVAFVLIGFFVSSAVGSVIGPRTAFADDGQAFAHAITELPSEEQGLMGVSAAGGGFAAGLGDGMVGGGAAGVGQAGTAASAGVGEGQAGGQNTLAQISTNLVEGKGIAGFSTIPITVPVMRDQVKAAGGRNTNTDWIRAYSAQFAQAAAVHHALTSSYSSVANMNVFRLTEKLSSLYTAYMFGDGGNALFAMDSKSSKVMMDASRAGEAAFAFSQALGLAGFNMSVIADRVNYQIASFDRLHDDQKANVKASYALWSAMHSDNKETADVTNQWFATYGMVRELSSKLSALESNHGMLLDSFTNAAESVKKILSGKSGAQVLDKLVAASPGESKESIIEKILSGDKSTTDQLLKQIGGGYSGLKGLIQNLQSTGEALKQSGVSLSTTRDALKESEAKKAQLAQEAQKLGLDVKGIEDRWAATAKAVRETAEKLTGEVQKLNEDISKSYTDLQLLMAELGKAEVAAASGDPAAVAALEEVKAKFGATKATWQAQRASLAQAEERLVLANAEVEGLGSNVSLRASALVGELQVLGSGPNAAEQVVALLLRYAADGATLTSARLKEQAANDRNGFPILPAMMGGMGNMGSLFGSGGFSMGDDGQFDEKTLETLKALEAVFGAKVRAQIEKVMMNLTASENGTLQREAAAREAALKLAEEMRPVALAGLKDFLGGSSNKVLAGIEDLKKSFETESGVLKSKYSENRERIAKINNELNGRVPGLKLSPEEEDSRRAELDALQKENNDLNNQFKDLKQKYSLVTSGGQSDGFASGVVKDLLNGKRDVPVTDQNGFPVYKVGADGQYLKDASGNFIQETREYDPVETFLNLARRALAPETESSRLFDHMGKESSSNKQRFNDVLSLLKQVLGEDGAKQFLSSVEKIVNADNEISKKEEVANLLKQAGENSKQKDALLKELGVALGKAPDKQAEDKVVTKLMILYNYSREDALELAANLTDEERDKLLKKFGKKEEDKAKRQEEKLLKMAEQSKKQAEFEEKSKALESKYNAEREDLQKQIDDLLKQGKRPDDEEVLALQQKLGELDRKRQEDSMKLNMDNMTSMGEGMSMGMEDEDDGGILGMGEDDPELMDILNGALGRKMNNQTAGGADGLGGGMQPWLMRGMYGKEMMSMQGMMMPGMNPFGEMGLDGDLMDAGLYPGQYGGGMPGLDGMDEMFGDMGFIYDGEEEWSFEMEGMEGIDDSQGVAGADGAPTGAGAKRAGTGTRTTGARAGTGTRSTGARPAAASSQGAGATAGGGFGQTPQGGSPAQGGSLDEGFGDFLPDDASQEGGASPVSALTKTPPTSRFQVSRTGGSTAAGTSRSSTSSSGAVVLNPTFARAAGRVGAQVVQANSARGSVVSSMGFGSKSGAEGIGEGVALDEGSGAALPGSSGLLRGSVGAVGRSSLSVGAGSLGAGGGMASVNGFYSALQTLPTTSMGLSSMSTGSMASSVLKSPFLGSTLAPSGGLEMELSGSTNALGASPTTHFSGPALYASAGLSSLISSTTTRGTMTGTTPIMSTGMFFAGTTTMPTMTAPLSGTTTVSSLGSMTPTSTTAPTGTLAGTITTTGTLAGTTTTMTAPLVGTTAPLTTSGTTDPAMTTTMTAGDSPDTADTSYTYYSSPSGDTTTSPDGDTYTYQPYAPPPGSST